MIAIWWILPDLDYRLDYTASLFLMAVFVFVAGVIALVSLRQTLCYLIALLVGLELMDLTIFFFATFVKFEGRGSPGAGLVFLLFGLVALPLGFIAALVLANMKLPANLLAGVGKSKRQLVAGLVSLSSLAAIVLFVYYETMWFR